MGALQKALEAKRDYWSGYRERLALRMAREAEALVVMLTADIASLRGDAQDYAYGGRKASLESYLATCRTMDEIQHMIRVLDEVAEGERKGDRDEPVNDG